jgi:hypothetical protein
MNFLPWNIVRKDFRLTRNYLVVWWGILAAGAIITIWNLNQIMQYPNQFYQTAQRGLVLEYSQLNAEELPYLSNWLVLGLDTVLLVVIVDLIFKSDSPIDERAEWRTRPVSGVAVLRAKLLYLGLFCYLVPWAIQTVERLYLGGDGADCLRGLGHFVVLQSLIIAIIASAAVLFQRTFMGLLVFFCGLVVAILLLAQTQFFDVISPDILAAPFREGRPVAWVACGILGCTWLGVSALMYAGRRRKTGLLALGGGVLAAILVYLIGMKYPYASPVAPALDHRVQISFDAHPVRWVGSVLGYPGQTRLGISPKITFGGTPDTVLQVTDIRSTLTWPALKLPPLKTTGAGRPLFMDSGLIAAAGYGRLLGDFNYYYKDYPASYLQLSNKQLAQLVAQPANWQCTVTGAIGRLSVDWDVPLANGAEWKYNQSLFKVEKFQRTFLTPRGEVGFRLWVASSSTLPRMATTPPSENNFQVFLLYNPTKKESLRGQIAPIDGADETNVGSLSIYSLANNWADFDFADIFGTKYPLQPDDATIRALNLSHDKVAYRAYLVAWEKDRTTFLQLHYKEMADWLAGAHLVELRFVPEKQVYNTATADSVQVITPDVLPDKKP